MTLRCRFFPISPFSVRPANAKRCEIQGLSKCDPETSSVGPNNPAMLPGTAEQQFKSIRQLGLSRDLKACAARGIVYNSAINDGMFRANDQFRRIGIPACRPHTCEPSRMHQCLLGPKIQQTGSQNILNASLSFIVIVIENAHCLLSCGTRQKQTVGSRKLPRWERDKQSRRSPRTDR